MSNQPDSVDLRPNMVFGIADDKSDLSYAIDVLQQAGIECGAEGSRIWAYTLLSADPHRAQQVISASHRYRTGDLHVFLVERPFDYLSGDMDPAEVQRFFAWRDGLRARNRRRTPFPQ